MFTLVPSGGHLKSLPFLTDPTCLHGENIYKVSKKNENTRVNCANKHFFIRTFFNATGEGGCTLNTLAKFQNNHIEIRESIALTSNICYIFLYVIFLQFYTKNMFK